MTIDERIDLAQQKMLERIKSKIDGECHLRYACYDEDDDCIPVDNLDEIAFSGEVIFEDEIAEVRSDKTYSDPTWIQVCLEANEIINTSGNKHHVCLEGLYRMNYEDELPAIVALDFGS